MAKKITFSTQKGGVGKTTSVVVVAEILASAGFRVLVVDTDSQGNSTKALTGKSKYTYSGCTLMEAVQENNAAGYTLEVKENLYLIPAEDKVAVFSRYIYTQKKLSNAYNVLLNTIEPIESQYDFILFDVGPALGDMMLNVLVAADFVVVPADCGEDAYEAISRVLEFVEATREEGHTKARVAGIILTMKDGRSKYDAQIAELARSEYGELVFKAEIKKRAKIKAFSTYGVDLKDPVLADYMDFTEELLGRMSLYEQ